MTPNEIATDITMLGATGSGNINWSTSATYCLGPVGTTGTVPDDQQSCD